MTGREIAKLERLHQENPSGTTFAPLAEAHRRQSEPERAIALLHAGLEMHPQHAPGWIVLGRCHLDLADEPEAESDFARVLECDPGNAIALQALADIAERQGRYDESERWLTELLQVDHGNETARTQLARVTGAKGLSEPPLAEVVLTGHDDMWKPSEELSDEAFEPAEVTDDEAGPEVAIEFAPGDLEEAGVEVEEWSPLGLADVEGNADAPDEADEAVLADETGFEEIELSEPVAYDAGELEIAVDTDDLELDAETVESADDQVEWEPDAAVFDERSAIEGERRAIEEEDIAEPFPAVADAEVLPLEEEPGVEADAAEPAERDQREVSGLAAGLPPFEEAGELSEPAHGVSVEPDEGAAPRVEPEPVATETMAELYLSQGHRQEALGIYRLLLADQPDDQRLKDKVAALEEEPVRPSRARPSGGVASDYAAAARGGQSVTDFLKALLTSRPDSAAPAPPPPVATESGAPASGPGSDAGRPGMPATGEPTRPAQDRLSLSAIFGEDASPVPPAVRVPAGGGMASAVGPKTGRFSFDAFFGGQRGEALAAHDAGRAGSHLDDEDLDQFQAWLQKLKS